MSILGMAGWSSSVARWAHNPEAVGSNPTPATTKRIIRPDSAWHPLEQRI